MENRFSKIKNALEINLREASLSPTRNSDISCALKRKMAVIITPPGESPLYNVCINVKKFNTESIKETSHHLRKGARVTLVPSGF